MAVPPARGPPLWDVCDAPNGDGVDVVPEWETDAQWAAQPAPHYQVDQRVSW